MTFEINKKLNFLLTDFLVKFNYLLCSDGTPITISASYLQSWLCFLKEYNVDYVTSGGNPSKGYGWRKFFKKHNDGGINNFLKLFNTDLCHFFNDVECGFFNDLMNGFVSYLAVDGVNESINLKSPRKYGNDSLEKLFSDFFVSEKTEPIETVNLSKDKIDLIDLFYNKVRPGLEHIYSKRNSTWFTHVGENREKLIYENGKSFPNLESYIQMEDRNLDYWYPIRSDFKKSDFEIPPYAVFDERFPFSKHYTTYNEGCVKGMIEINNYIELGGQVFFSGVRDHPYLVSRIPLENWLFLFNSTTSMDIEPDINILIDSNIMGLVSIENVFLFSELYNTFSARMDTLKHA